jgi:hypothetical protein
LNPTGVLCFPYGALLDCAFAMLNRAEAMASPNSAFENQERREQEYDDVSNIIRKIMSQ